MIRSSAAVEQMKWLNLLEPYGGFSVLTRSMTMANGALYYKVSLVPPGIALQF